MKIKELKEKILIDVNGQPLNPKKCLIQLGQLLYLDNDKKTLWACPIMKDNTLDKDQDQKPHELNWYEIDFGFAEFSKLELKIINKFFKTNF